MRNFSRFALASVSLIGLMQPMAAFAQAAAPADDATEDDDQIVVVGSLIRGTTVTGSQTISVDTDTIADKMAGSTNELLGLIPQISNTFNGRFEGDPRGVGAGISITKPNLRGLPGANSSSGGTTLVLLDGFRFAPVGVNQSAVDTDVIPAAVLAGVDVVTDGGSSLYGADAVAGVINFRSLRTFDGLKIDANYGFGTTLKHFGQWDGQVTAGASWATGNAYISGGYSHRDLVLNNETTWATGEIYSATGVARFTGTQCNTPVGTETRWFRFGGGATSFTNNPLAPGAGTFAVGTACDNVGQNTYSPEQTRYNVFAALTNEFSDSVSLRITGYWTKRDTELGIVPRGVTSAGSGITNAAQLTTAFPAALLIAPGSLFAVTEGVGFSLAPNAAYVNTPNKLGLETWGVTPELTVKLSGDWQVRATAHFGRSTNFQSFPGVDAAKAQCYITGCTAATSPTGAAIAAGQLNPFNVAAASAAVIGDITNYYNDQDTNQQLFVTRVVADGPLFALPGGDAKLAVGLEYQENKAESRLGAVALNGLDALPFRSYSRNAKSGFAELQLPLTDFFTLSGSVRYDDYNDFGSTTNPSIGATLRPTEWLKIFGHWNTSYNAPTALDGLGIAVGRLVCGIYTVGVGSASRPFDPGVVDDNGQGTCAMISEGVKAGIGPQTAESWAVGFEVTPTAGLRFGGEFYSIDFTDVLGAVNPQNLNTYTTNPDLYHYAVTPAQYAAFLAQFTNGAQLATQKASTDIALYVDRRASNLGSAKLEGVDFHVYYDGDIGAGRLSMGVAGTKTTKSQANFGVLTDELGNGGPELTFTTFMGVKFGGFSSRVTVNYSGMYHDTAPNVTGFLNTAVSPFTTVNLNFGYDLGESGGPLAGTSLRLSVDNLFEATPQIIQRGGANNNTYANWTMGRVIKLGASLKF
jgi:iron complex outermembrane recepter protein